jgi:hypothetical protein
LIIARDDDLLRSDADDTSHIHATMLRETAFDERLVIGPGEESVPETARVGERCGQEIATKLRLS